MITLFATCKPFNDPHIACIQRNAIEAWTALGSQVEVILIGDEEGTSEAAARFGVRHIADVARNAEGTPLVSSMFETARAASSADVLCYANADVIFFPDLIESVERVGDRFDRYLLVGQRWDLDVPERLRFEVGWTDRLLDRVRTQAERHRPAGSDYFVFPRTLDLQMPPFALGRSGWDNWMIYFGRRSGAAVVDASEAITVVHQNHDYGHLPGGAAHYRLPESDENIRLAGGREFIFLLRDAPWRLSKQGLQRKSRRERGGLRSPESDLIVRFGPGRRARLIRALFHPRQFIRYAVRGLRKAGPSAGAGPLGAQQAD